MRGTDSLDVIARSANVSKASLYRHAQGHLLPRLKSQISGMAPAPADDKEIGALEAIERLTVRAEALPLYKRLMRLAITAERERNWPATRAFLAEARQTLELAGRAQGEFLPDPIDVERKPFVIIIATPQPQPGAMDDGAWPEPKVQEINTIDVKALSG